MPFDVVSIAHRGASGILPENTRHAFVKALDLGARVIELDVQLTRDEVPVVIHDETLDRTTNGTGLVVETDFTEIAELDAGSWFGASFVNVEVPTLDEVLRVIGSRAMVNIELKPDEKRVDTLVKHVVTTVARLNCFDNVVFSSFDLYALKRLRHLVPGAQIGVLCCEREKIDEAIAFARLVKARNIHPSVPLVDTELIKKAHARGWHVWAWTANEPGEIALLAAIGVDGIFSDHPDRVASCTESRRSPAA
ncbi:MAG: glycerophosphodiester phosphodiesterase family protein [Candidatus Binatia bacterium]